MVIGLPVSKAERGHGRANRIFEGT
jgi:hypothetical protein